MFSSFHALISWAVLLFVCRSLSLSLYVWPIDFKIFVVALLFVYFYLEICFYLLFLLRCIFHLHSPTSSFFVSCSILVCWPPFVFLYNFLLGKKKSLLGFPRKKCCFQSACLVLPCLFCCCYFGALLTGLMRLSKI